MIYKNILPIAFLSLAVFAPIANCQKLSVEEVIAQHINSIAPAEKRSAFTSLIAVGEVSVNYITQKNLSASGRIVLASEGSKMFVGMSLNASDYPQEKFIFDGEKSSVAFVRNGTRSVLGNFIESNSILLSQGLLSGVLTSSWTFINPRGLRGKLSLTGMKKVEGKETYGISYSPKGGSDVDITMYFDKQTFRHVRTEYKRIASASIGRTIDQSARQIETRLKLTEDFSDFKKFEDFTLPTRYKISYSVTGQNGTNEIEWDCNISEFAVNRKLDAGTFATGE